MKPKRHRFKNRKKMQGRKSKNNQTKSVRFGARNPASNSHGTTRRPY